MDGTGRFDLDEFVSAHWEAAFRYAFRLCGNAAEAEDLVQQTFLIAQRKLWQLRDAQCCRSWLYTVVRNCFLQTRRRARLPTEAAPDWDRVADDRAAPGAGASETLDDEELSLRSALAGLSDEHRVVLLMYYFEERSYQEIATELGVALGTVMSRLNRAKQRLRVAMTETAAGHGPAAFNGPAVRG